MGAHQREQLPLCFQSCERPCGRAPGVRCSQEVHWAVALDPFHGQHAPGCVLVEHPGDSHKGQVLLGGLRGKGGAHG